MAINKLMRLALKALSYPDIDMKKIYPLERTVKEQLKSPHLLKPLYQLWDHKVICAGREILVRIYEPKQPPRHTLLFFHGGGWVSESVDTYNSVCLNLARRTQSRVLSVQYRLAPEHPFPQGLDDCYAVTRELLCNSAGWDVFPGQVTLIGDSAGGNLCAAVSLLARDRGEFCVPQQILLYPAVYSDHTDQSPYPSVIENGTDYLLTSKRISEYMQLYIHDEKDWRSPYFAPLLAGNFENLPRTLVITAQYDPLRDEGEDYAARLAQAGGDASCYQMRDALHGFFSLGPRYVHVKKTYELINAFLDEGDFGGGKAQ